MHNVREHWQELFREAQRQEQQASVKEVQEGTKRLPPIFKVAFPAPHPLDKTQK